MVALCYPSYPRWTSCSRPSFRLKASRGLWQQFFLDAGAGFWEQWPDAIVSETLADDAYRHVEYAGRFNIRGVKFSTSPVDRLLPVVPPRF